MTSKKQLEELVELNPAARLANELNKRKIDLIYFSNCILEFPTVIYSIISGEIPLSETIARKCEAELKLPDGYFSHKKVKLRNFRHNDGRTRPRRDAFIDSKALYDVHFYDIDWLEDRHTIINRITELGSDREKDELDEFYSPGIVQEILKINRNEVPRTMEMVDGQWKYIEK